MAIPTDPFLPSQWHLGNTTPGLLDLNVRGVWDPVQGPSYTGAGIRVLVIDDGFDYTHADLAPNWDTVIDFDWDANNNGDNGNHDFDPFGQPGDRHGTAVAGIIGADNNGTGAVGVAFDASLVGYRIHGLISDGWLQDLRDAIHHSAATAQADVVNISQGIANDENSEWGIGYNATRFDEIETSIGTAVTTGRGGLGTTIVKSAGNSRTDDFDVNADDWTNDTRQVVVGAVDQNGFVSSYSSYGAALLVSAFGTPGDVVTTDRVGAPGYNATDFAFFNGTSAAAPMVAGVVALIYDANPNLGWRDVQTILANTARHVGSDVGGVVGGAERYLWQFNAADTWNGGGLHFSNDYGYGLVDALAAVRLAETWLLADPAQTSGNELTNTLDMLNAATVVPDGNGTGLTFTGNATFADEVERVTVAVTFSTTFTGDLELYVTSPDGTVSELIDDVGVSSDFNGTWTFETQAFRGERADGMWSVRIVDDAGADVLVVSDIVVRTWGRFSSNDRYVYTNEYSDYDGLFGHGTTLFDSNGGVDTVNASAVTSNSVINLIAGAIGSIDGATFVVGAGVVIENAVGGDGNDTLTGNGSVNLLSGGRGNDSLNGGGSNDTLSGVDGNDQINGGVGGDNIDGGVGYDFARYDFATTGVQARLDNAALNSGEAAGDTMYNFEGLVGGQIGDILVGNNLALGNQIYGLGGPDSIYGLGGPDTFFGGRGNDTIFTGVGTDTVMVQAADRVAGEIDRVVDFTNGQDVLRFQGIAAASATISDSQGGTLIRLNVPTGGQFLVFLFNISAAASADQIFFV